VTSSGPRDVMSILEAAHAEASGPDEWLRNAFAAAAPLLDCGLGAVAYRFAHEDGGLWVGDFILSGGFTDVSAGEVRDFLPKVPDSLFPDRDRQAFLRRLFARAPAVGSFLELSGLEQEGWLERFPVLRSVGLRDSLGIMAGNPSGHGCVIANGTPARATLSPSARDLWMRVAAHLATGYRLSLRSQPQVDAVFKPDGRLEHVESSEVPRPECASLADATRAIDRARGKLRRVDPDGALALWQGLVRGRWTLVDHVDHDGRRYVFAKRNPPDARPWHTLTEDETSVLAYAAHGHSHKMIGYELGIAVSTVAARLTRAARKVGVRSRIELVAAYQRRGPDGTSAP
jgi:DNA-binding CsgD family transcriptional regulator